MSVLRKYMVRYGAMRLRGIFTFPSDDPLFHGTRVILRTSRGQEAGTVLREPTPESMGTLPYSYEEGRIVRVMTPDDEKQCRSIWEVEKEEYPRAKAIIAQSKLQMDLVRVEHIFGGERLIVYYLAEERVDFRELVRVLAAEFHTRIEMRQIGPRDETKLQADVGDCGRECCCGTYLYSMQPVSMKMAKLQRATLDPTKVSGRCGRLKCCLRFEYEDYVELQKALPAIGSQLATPDGPGQVIGQELLAQRVQVEFEDRSRKTYTLEEIRSAANPKPEEAAPAESEPDEPAAEGAVGIPAPDPFDELKPSETYTGSIKKPKSSRNRRPGSGSEEGALSPRKDFGKRADSRPEPRPGAPRKEGSRREAPPRRETPRRPPVRREGPPREGFPKDPFPREGGAPPKRGYPKRPPRFDPNRRPRPENRDRGFRNKRKESE
ncbi:MAG: hypothetical protein IJG60_04785 [Thermoguttaceae bacterium]|nr:hypothetical protein [Thermoguttaceae bacterium]